MGFFDRFKKSADTPAQAAPAPAPAEAKSIGFKFGTKMPIPFRDPTFGLLYLNANGSAAVIPEDPSSDPQALSEFAKTLIIDQLNDVLYKIKDVSYDALPARSEEFAARIREAVSPKVKLQALTIDSIAPDERSLDMIEKRKIAMDPQLTAKKMQEAMEKARASVIANGGDPDKLAVRPMPDLIANVPTTLSNDPAEVMKQMEAIKAAAAGTAILGFCASCGKPFSREGFCEECGAPVSKPE